MSSIDDLLMSEIGSYSMTETTLELGGETVTLFAKPLTSADLQFINRTHPGFMTAPTAEGVVDMLIRKAVDNDGKAIFTKAHKVPLMRVRSDKLLNAFGNLFKGQVEEPDDETEEARVGN